MKQALTVLVATLLNVMMGTSTRDCLECWREVCMSSEFIIDDSFSSDCCNCVEGSVPACQIATHNASNFKDCCNTARDSIISQLSPQSGSNVCSEYLYIHRDELIPISPSELRNLSAGVYLVPEFKFQCRGCVENILVQALIPGYVYVDDNPDPITITMNFMIWTPLVDSQSEEDSLYSLRYNVTKMVTEDDISAAPAQRDQLTLNFSLYGNELCFNKSEVFGWSSGSTPAVQLILTRPDSSLGPIHSLSSSEDGTCPELNEFHKATLVQDDRQPLMAIRIRSPQPVTQLPSSSGASVPNATTNPSPTSEPPTDSQLPVSPGVIIGVTAGSIGVFALLACIFLTVFIMHQRSRRTDLTKNAAYGVRRNEVELQDNEAYTTTATAGGADVGGEYDYITRTNDTPITTTPNEAYGGNIYKMQS